MSDLRIRIADEISNIQVGSGYESTTIGITAALEAADALIAAGVVAEEPEWEYRIAVGGEHEWPFGPRDEEQGAPLEEVQAALGGQHGDPMSGDIERRAKAIPAGPLVPVKQEGAEP